MGALPGFFRRFSPGGPPFIDGESPLSKRLDTLREQVNQLCERVDVPNPGEFLASIMAGVDPRPRRPLLHKLVERLDGYPPEDDEWEDIEDLILNSGLYDKQPVDIKESISAADKLMDFLHAKLKAIEIQQEVSMSVQVAPLTRKEAEMFEEIWRERFE